VKLLVTLAVGALLLGACGGDDDAGSDVELISIAANR
jgi:hypothetical protein